MSFGEHLISIVTTKSTKIGTLYPMKINVSTITKIEKKDQRPKTHLKGDLKLILYNECVSSIVNTL